MNAASPAKPDDSHPASDASAPLRGRLRIATLIACLVLMALAYWLWSAEGSLDRWADRQTQLRELLEQHPVAVSAAAFVVYVVITSALIGSATVVSLLYGWLFGFVLGTLIVSFASTAGACITFLVSRYVFRAAVEARWGRQVAAVDTAFRENGIAYLLTLRLIPGIPFFLLNALMGLTPIRWTTFWWVSQLGMLPATLIFLYAGSTLPDLATLRTRGVSSVFTPPFFVALVLLGLLPLGVAWLRTSRWNPRRSVDGPADQD